MYIYDVVISLLLAGKNLEAGTIKVAKGTKGTCRTGTGMSAYRSGLLLPPGSKIKTVLKLVSGNTIVTGIERLYFSDNFHHDKT